MSHVAYGCSQSLAGCASLATGPGHNSSVRQERAHPRGYGLPVFYPCIYSAVYTLYIRVYTAPVFQIHVFRLIIAAEIPVLPLSAPSSVINGSYQAAKGTTTIHHGAEEDTMRIWSCGWLKYSVSICTREPYQTMMPYLPFQDMHVGRVP